MAVWQPSQVYNGNPYANKMVSFLWIEDQGSIILDNLFKIQLKLKFHKILYVQNVSVDEFFHSFHRAWQSDSHALCETSERFVN